MEEETFTEQESLALIRTMIHTAKNDYWESGTGALLWGFTNVICFILSYFQFSNNHFKLPFNPFLLMILTLGIQLFAERKEKKYKTVVSLYDDIHKNVWIAFAVSVLILTFSAGLNNYGFRVIPPLIILFAIPTYISGKINKFTPLIVAGIICWMIAFGSFFIYGPKLFLLAALSATIAWIIPGFILRAGYVKKRKLQYGV